MSDLRHDPGRPAVHPAAAPTLGTPRDLGERRRKRHPAEADGRLQEALAGPQKQNPLNVPPAAVDRLDLRKFFFLFLVILI